MAVVAVDEAVHDMLRDFATDHGVSQVQLVAAIIRRLYLRKIDVDEAIEEARAADASGRRRG